ncbi:hypothetical protein N7494_003253 [Penicillium frequentans]|uniref:Uncharacterized protein n=1 Tax=Penicillium frequentans TaxID=3151616 RepID=A0AAD6GHM9_9EURO|nr:hypothetical protein N7494_003253 [Penicillium glabrum]
MTRAQLPPSDYFGQESLRLATPDMPANLLALTSYASLAKLYMMVHLQIRNHLRRLPGSTSLHCTPVIPQAGELEPEELSPSPMNITWYKCFSMTFKRWSIFFVIPILRTLLADKRIERTTNREKDSGNSSRISGLTLAGLLTNWK